MREHTVITLVCMALAGSSPAHADCSDIIAMSRLTASVVQSQSQIDEYARRFCSDYARYNGNSVQIEASASYGLFSAALGVGVQSVEQLATKYCDAQNHNVARNDSYRAYVESIAPGTYESYNTCIALQSDDVRVSVQRSTILAKEMFVNVTFSSRSHGVPPHSVQWSATAGVACRWNDISGSTTISLPNLTSAILHCTRTNDARKDAVNVNVTTRAQSFISLPWSAFAHDVPIDYLALIHQQLADASRATAALRTEVFAEVAKTNGLIPRVETGIETISEINSPGCDPGKPRRGRTHARITFGQPFKVAPRVTVGLSYLDSNWPRIRAAVESVDETGFTYTFDTWCDSNIYAAQMQWTAIGH